MSRQLDPIQLQYAGSLVDSGTTWSDYDGSEAYGDFTVASASPWTVTNTDQYQPGMWRKAGTAAEYLHSDMLGTLRQTTGTTGSAGASRVFTAFGERITQTTDRFGYVGAYGYQSTVDTSGAEVFPFLHVGARYYDPSSGRFLQRDPIGIGEGSNVYAYVMALPTIRVDPSGLGPVGGAIGGVIGGGVGAVAGAALCAFLTKNPWAAIGAAGAGGTAGAGVGTAVGSGIEDVLRDLWNRPRAPLPPCASTFQGCGGGGHRW